jgi:hypothetical protein
MLFGHERDLVRSIELRAVIRHHHSKLERMLTRFDAVQSSAPGLKHAHQFAIDISMNMMTALSFVKIKLEWDSVTAKSLSFCGRHDRYGGALGWCLCIRIALPVPTELRLGSTMRAVCTRRECRKKSRCN